MTDISDEDIEKAKRAVGRIRVGLETRYSPQADFDTILARAALEAVGYRS